MLKHLKHFTLLVGLLVQTVSTEHIQAEIGLAGYEKDDDRVTVVFTPRREAVLSAEVAGRVVEIGKELGSCFEADEVLVRLDDSVYEVNRNVAQAMLTAAKSNLAHVEKLAKARTRVRHAEAVLSAAKAALAATQRLFDDNHASQLDLENAKRDEVVAQTNLELVTATAAEELSIAQREATVAAGKLAIAENQLEDCTVRVPWSGRVSRVLVNEHELVQGGTPVIEVIDDRALLAKFLLPSSVFRSVRLGQELKVQVQETARNVTVKVSHIAAALDPASVTFEVHAVLDNSSGDLRAGMNGFFSLAELGEN